MNNFNYTRPPITNYQKAIVDSLACCTVSESSVKVGKTTSHIIWLFEQALKGKKGDNFLFVTPNFPLANIAFSRMKAQVSYPQLFLMNLFPNLDLPYRMVLIFGLNQLMSQTLYT
ncbi:hypothetical protein V9L05_17695 [Bernardetia sp. Wsw4-3y2]|uniref:hypothetical protein n=1 Tax=Bernardetia sp. Wsw4-3y2 TaxID=3127471 RepID=UPI0030D0AB77